MKRGDLLMGSATLTWLLIVAGLSFAAAQPECFTEATSTGVVHCDNQDLTAATAADFDKISGLTLSTIKTVEIINCQLTNLDFLSSRFLTGVKTLLLGSNTGLTNDHLPSLSGMRDSLEDMTISGMESLQTIGGLVRNRQAWRSLKALRVNGCGLTSVDAAIYENTPAVTSYDFSRNSLTELDVTSHTSVATPLTFIASNNRLTSVQGMERFINLNKLDLANNQLTGSVMEMVNALLGRSRITELDLSTNQLFSFNLDPLPPGETARPIDTINLDNNSLQEIKPLGLSRAQKTKKLILSRNNHLRLDLDTLKGMSELQDLRLNGCGQEQITTHLQNLPALQKLRLQQNQLQDVSMEAFTGTTGLQTLMLQNNELTSVKFLSSVNVILDQLTHLDISYNRLDRLQNFVATPKLVDLRMNGFQEKNKFSQLSACKYSFTEFPATLRVVCAREIEAEGTCLYQTFWKLLENKVLYNNKACCDNSADECCRETQNCVSSWPTEDTTCGDKEAVCETVLVTPVVTPRSGTNQTPSCKIKPRADFEELRSAEVAVMVIGYVLAVIFFIIMFVLFVRRYRSYDKWLHDYRDNENGAAAASPPIHTRVSDASLDFVDSPSTSKSARVSPRPAGALPRGSPKVASKSLDNISMASDRSHYSTIGKGTFSGRSKFKDNAPPPIEMDRYTSPSSRRRHESSEDSPTALSVYSYASHQPERSQRDVTPPAQRRRHRSGGTLPQPRGRSRSQDDMLDSLSVDSDLVPTPVKILLQREATLKGDEKPTDHMPRNSRAYASAPHRAKGRPRKKSVSPLLAVQTVHRNPGAPTPPSSRRALPATPTDGGSPHSMRSRSSAATGGSSNTSRRNDFAMDDDDFITFEETEGYGD